MRGTPVGRPVFGPIGAWGPRSTRSSRDFFAGTREWPCPAGKKKPPILANEGGGFLSFPPRVGGGHTLGRGSTAKCTVATTRMQWVFSPRGSFHTFTFSEIRSGALGSLGGG